MSYRRLFYSLIILLTPSFSYAQSTEVTEDWVQSFHIENLILKEKSKYQKIVIFKNKTLGKVLMLDDVIQLSDTDYFIYNEMISHVPLVLHPKPKSILIIGGGDGAVLREVLKHPTVNLVTVVEIDAMVVDLCQKYFPHLSKNAFEDSRVRLLIDGGYKYLKKTTTTYDVIIVNSTDTSAPSKGLFKKQFYERCHDSLNENGILVCEIGSPILQLETLKSNKKIKEKIFPSSYFYFSPAPSQLTGIKSFALSFKDKGTPKLSPKELNKRAALIQGELKFYSPESHLSAFYIPKYLEKDLDD